MSVLTFRAGKNFETVKPDFVAGTIYFDTATGEMWVDDPSNTLTDHSKVIDTGTLIYGIEETITFTPPAASSKVTAKLGTAVLGTMILGTE